MNEKLENNVFKAPSEQDQEFNEIQTLKGWIEFEVKKAEKLLKEAQTNATFWNGKLAILKKHQNTWNGIKTLSEKAEEVQAKE